MIARILIWFLGVCSILNSFEVNTHQALTQCAITNSCGNGYAKNLENFVKHGIIKYQSYANEIFHYVYFVDPLQKLSVTPEVGSEYKGIQINYKF